MKTVYVSNGLPSSWCAAEMRSVPGVRKATPMTDQDGAVLVVDDSFDVARFEREQEVLATTDLAKFTRMNNGEGA